MSLSWPVPKAWKESAAWLESYKMKETPRREIRLFPVLHIEVLFRAFPALQWVGSRYMMLGTSAVSAISPLPTTHPLWKMAIRKWMLQNRETLRKWMLQNRVALRIELKKELHATPSNRTTWNQDKTTPSLSMWVSIVSQRENYTLIYFMPM